MQSRDQLLFATNAVVKQANQEGITSLSTAQEGQALIAQDAKTLPIHLDNTATNSLIHAAEQGHTDTVKTLLASNVAPDMVNTETGETALMFASEKNNTAWCRNKVDCRSATYAYRGAAYHKIATSCW